MLNKIWPMFIIFSVGYGIISGNIENVNNSIFESTENTIKLTMTLLGSICLWSGIMKIASNTSIIERLSRLLNPVINFLFTDLRTNEKIKKEISMNMIANILGLGNAATPTGIKAMKSMQKINKEKNKLSNSMMMFILINTASIQLIPTTVLAIRKSLNSNNITWIIIPVWISTMVAAISGIIGVKILMKKNK